LTSSDAGYFQAVEFGWVIYTYSASLSELSQGATLNRRTRVFISYKTGVDTGLTFQAHSIRQRLEAAQYAVWMDTENLAAGLDWNKQIYSRIPQSDIVLLLLASETAESDWVRREIDVAKGAKVTILPVLIRGDFDKQEALDRLDIPRLQFASLLSGNEEEFEKLTEAIESLKHNTRDQQEAWLSELREGGKSKAYDPPDKSIAVFRVGHREIHLAGGNMLGMKDIDVFVNSENDYMQMAKIFESRTVSSLLRYAGSKIDGAQRLVEDTVQEELDQQVKTFGTRPLGKSTVIATSAGHPSGELFKSNHARYIFHAATVSVMGDGQDKRLEALGTASGIKGAVKRTLEHIRVVDEKQGVVSPEGTEQRKSQEREREDGYKPIESIILPAYGTGSGGRPLFEVAPAIIRAIHEFCIDSDLDSTLQLKRIHFCVFSDSDVKEVLAVMKDELGAKPGKPAL
jgi:O-acetyl-ADP-ribose deacetylase (regulator of RNase III)